MIESPDRLLPDVLKTGLNTKVIAKNIEYYSILGSTNEQAHKLAKAGAIDGTVVIAEIQSTGRGRRGRIWISPQGGIWLTIILRPEIPPINAPIITMMAGVVVARTIQKITDLTPTLKWPNDVRLSNKKVCGILTEMSTEQDVINYILVGLGINVNISRDEFPKELQDYVTSLQQEQHSKLDRISFTQKLFNQFEKEYISFSNTPNKTIPDILQSWRKLSDTIGQYVRVETISGDITGVARDITDDGALLVQEKNGKEHKILAGDCIYLKD